MPRGRQTPVSTLRFRNQITSAAFIIRFSPFSLARPSSFSSHSCHPISSLWLVQFPLRRWGCAGNPPSAGLSRGGGGGAAGSNSRPQPGAKTFGGLEGGGGGGVSGSAAGVPGGGGGQWVPQHTLPQNDPHDALIIWNIHNWGKKSFQKKFAHLLRLPSAKVQPGGQVRGANLFLCFSPILEFSINF